MKTFKNCLKLVGLIILIANINTFPMFLIGQQENIPQSARLGLGVGYILIASLIIGILWRAYRKHYPQTLPFGWKDFGIALLYWLAGRVVAVVGTLIIQYVTGNAMSTNDAALQASEEALLAMFPLFFVAFQLALGLFAPIVEELVFRGFFSHYFFKNKWAKLLASSTLFGLIHIALPIEFPMYFALGAIFYLAYARRGNIKDAIAVHMLNNGIIILVSVINYIYLIMQ